MITAFIIVGCIVAACTVLSLFVLRRSGQLREAWQDDAECAALAEWNAKHRRHSNTAVSASQ